MKKCKSCQTEIDQKATKCPHCKSDQRGWFRRHPILTVILGLFVFSIFMGAVGGSKPSSTTTSSKPVENTTNETEQAQTTQTETAKTEVKDEPSVPPEHRSALKKATSYAKTMHMSKKGVYDQLVADFGEKFSPESAQYAVDNVIADWNANALAKAKTYQDTMSMSPEAIRSQLTSSYGEKFTEAEADFAIQHLND